MFPWKNDSKVLRIVVTSFRSDKPYHTQAEIAVGFAVNYQFVIIWAYSSKEKRYGYEASAAVVNGWMNSSGHRANILNASCTLIGVGCCANGNYWMQMFIG